MGKKYSLNLENDHVISVEVDGIRYYSPDDIPDPEDREAIRRLMENRHTTDFPQLDAEALEFLNNGFPDVDPPRSPRWNQTTNSWDTTASTPIHQPDPFAKIFVSIFLSISVIMLAIAGISGYYTARAIAQEEETPGRVIDLTVRKDSSGNDYYYPIVEFTLPDQGLQTVQLNEGSWPPAYEPGESVTILYNPAQPRDARIQSVGSTVLRWVLTLITGILGVSFLAATFLAIWVFKATSSVSNEPR